MCVEPNGEYKKIGDAIAVAQPGTEIRIASGLYTENVEVKTPGLRLVPKDKEADIIWVSYSAPAITVNIPGDGKLFLTNFKLAHRATQVINQESKEKQEQAQKFLSAMASEVHDRGVVDDRDPNFSYAKSLLLYDKMNTLVYVKSGRVEITVSFVLSRTRFFHLTS